MHSIPLALITTLIFITGCSSTNSTARNQKASMIVMQADESKIDTVKISALHGSFLNGQTNSNHNGSIVQITGEVVAFALTEDGLYTITLREGEIDAVCVFDDTISGKLGDGRAIQKSATLTVRGQCHSAGLFASSPFSMDGCQIVK
ncbi:MAG: hypothetical protein P8N28_05330 [Phycisphaerales bacterium]|nr:hypothetical protein [Phycisphaerales bacterium]